MSTTGLALTALAAVAAPGIVHAQDSAKNDNVVNEVVVTANKRAETVQTVSGTVTAIKGEDLIEHGQKSLVDYAETVPGLNINTSGSNLLTTVSLRGIAATSGVATVATYIDESPLGSSGPWNGAASQVLNLLPYDVDRVEVLSGPQGTLYGASAIGGVIKYVLSTPDPSHFSAKAGVEFSTIDNADKAGYAVHAMVNIPIIQDKLAVRVSFFDDFVPGFINNANVLPNNGNHGVNTGRDQGGRVAVFFHPFEDLRLKFNWYTSNAASNSLGSEFFQSAVISKGASGAILGTPINSIGKDENYFTVPSTVRRKVDNFSLTADYHNRLFDVTSVTSYGRQRSALTTDDSLYYGAYLPILTAVLGSPVTAFAIQEDPGYDKVTEEVRVTSPKGQTIEWLAGGFYTNERATLPEILVPLSPSFTPVSTPAAYVYPKSTTSIPDVFQTAIPTKYQEWAIFGDATWNISKQWDVTAGFRYAENTQSFLANTAVNYLLFGTSINTSEKIGPNTDGVTTWSVSSRYHITPDVMVYGRIATGYQPGGANSPLPEIPLTFRPSTLTNYEGGIKSEWFDKTVLFDLTGYFIDWSKIQVVQVTSDGNFSYYGNGGKASVKGFELTTAWRPVHDLKLGFTSAYTDAALDQADPGTHLVTGYQLSGVPKITFAGTADYSFRLWRGNGTVGGSFKYQDKQNSGSAQSGTFPAQQPIYQTPSYTTENLYANYSFGRWTAHFFVRNLSNEHTPVTGSVSATLTGRLYGSWALLQPRTVGIGLDAAF